MIVLEYQRENIGMGINVSRFKIILNYNGSDLRSLTDIPIRHLVEKLNLLVLL